MTSETPPILVTGATRGLGRKTALALAKAGHSVLVGGRRRDAAEELCLELRSSGVGAWPFVADLSALAEVRDAARALGSRPLRAIVANAGMSSMRTGLRSADGIERTFAVNVLAHQLLLDLLAPRVVEGGRVVVLSSGVHLPDNKLARRAGVPVSEWLGVGPLLDPGNRLSAAGRYSTSKLGNVLQARALQKRLRDAERGVDVFALDPGLMVDTDLARELPAIARVLFRGVGRLATPFVANMRLSSTSAQHVVALAIGPEWSGRGFAYVDGDEAVPASPDAQRDDLVADFSRATDALLSPYLHGV
ncbi:MAG: SDR family NAD(P)-dependent oxidoreductase [Planctomycetota bacterium]